MLVRLFAVLSLALTLLVSAMRQISFLYAIPLLIGFFLLINVLFLAFLLVSSFFLPAERKAGEELAGVRFLVRVTMEWMTQMLLIRVRVSGTEKLPEEPFVLVCNHLSRYDPIVTFYKLHERKMAFISKQENLQIPIAGPYIRQAGFLPIDRENALRAMRTVRSAAEMIRTEGYCMGIYPEGTRSKTGQLLEFKAGAFVMAKKAGAPIVVTAIRGSFGIVRRPLWDRVIHLDILEVIPAETVVQKKPEELCEMTRECIRRHLDNGQTAPLTDDSPAPARV